jgi:GNAT superfamily N-acetyltransferase
MIYYQKDTLLIRTMNENDIEKILNNYREQNWSKPREVIESYLTRQNNGELFMFVAEYENDTAGYTVLYPNAKHGAFANKNIPEISDFIVFMKYQRKGMGSLILDVAEKKAFELAGKVSLGVGVHSGYGAAQRLYIKRGYVPDGTGVWYNNAPLEPYADCVNDDDLILYLMKEL